MSTTGLFEGMNPDRVTQLVCRKCGSILEVEEVDPLEEIACPECGTKIVIPAGIGGFFVYGLAGQGGMGSVFRAWDPELERMVALKLMHARGEIQHQTLEEFENEARAAAKINHRHIARVYDFGYHHGNPFLVMELVGGAHFDQIIRKGPPVKFDFALRTCAEIAEGLAEADSKGLVHGDVKPENILFDEEDNSKLVDFGLAAMVGGGGGEKIRGTPYYLAPEILLRRTIDARSDMYSLGATLYHALCGRPPFVGDNPKEIALARLHQVPEDPRAVCPGLSDHLARVILRMLEREPARRHPNYKSLTSDLGEAMRDMKKNPAPRVPRDGSRTFGKDWGGKIAEFGRYGTEVARRYRKGVAKFRSVTRSSDSSSTSDRGE